MKILIHFVTTFFAVHFFKLQTKNYKLIKKARCI